MSDEKNATKTFEMKVQEQQDKIEAQFRKITPWLVGPHHSHGAQAIQKQEFRQTAIICGIGLFVLGAIGFAILVVMDNFLPWLIHDVFGIGN